MIEYSHVYQRRKLCRATSSVSDDIRYIWYNWRFGQQKTLASTPVFVFQETFTEEIFCGRIFSQIFQLRVAVGKLKWAVLPAANDLLNTTACFALRKKWAAKPPTVQFSGIFRGVLPLKVH